VSLLSAQSVIRALDKSKYEVVPIGITKEGRWITQGDPMKALTGGLVTMEDLVGSPPRLINACQAIHCTTPRANRRPNRSGAFQATPIPRATHPVSNRITPTRPAKPKVSPITAKALSEWGSGIWPLRVHRLAPGPFPNAPPDRMAFQTAPRCPPGPSGWRSVWR